MSTLVHHVAPLLLVMFRLSGVFMLAPIAASLAIPAKVRVLLCFMLALCVYPTVQAPAGEFTDIFTLVMVGAGEVFIGFVIGLLALLPVVAVQLAGVLMGQQMGFGLGQLYNPMLETESDIIGEVLAQLAIGIFIAVGGLEMLFQCVANSFERVPLGAVAVGDAPFNLVLSTATSGFELALRVSTPVLGIIFIETLASSFLMKTIPALNILSIGFAVKVVLGLVALVWGLNAMDGAIGEHIAETGRQILNWSSQARPPVGSGGGL
ncbi:MAG: flagellar biosynthetic protein FliR [Phycisphaerales bacterium]